MTGFLAGLVFLLVAALAAGAVWRAESAVALTFGLGVLATAVTWSALFGMVTLPGLLTLLTLAAVAGALVRPAEGSLTAADTPVWSRLETLIIALITLHLLVPVLAVLVPPAGWDALTYHLALPSFYLRAGGLADNPSILNSTFPQGIEMLYLVSLWFEPHGQLALAVNVVFLLLLVILSVKLARALGVPRPWRLLAGLAVLLMPLTNRLGGYHNTDIPLTAYSTLALLMLARRQLVPALLAAALAVAVKYTGLIVFVLTVVMALALAWRAGRWRGAARVALAAPLLLLLAAGPWLLRNAAHTGNPLFPFAQAVFARQAAAAPCVPMPSPAGNGHSAPAQLPAAYAAGAADVAQRSAVADERETAAQLLTVPATGTVALVASSRSRQRPVAAGDDSRGAGRQGSAAPAAVGSLFTAVAGQYADKGDVYENRLVRLLRFPFDITLNFGLFDEWRYALGPLYLVLVSISLLFLRWRAHAPAVLLALLYGMLVVQLVPNARYLLPVLPCLAGVAMLGAAGLAARRRWWRVLLLVLVLGWGMLNLPLAFAQHYGNLRLLARVGYDRFVAEKLPFLDGVDYVHRVLRTDRGQLTAEPWRVRPRVCVVDKRIFPLGFETVSGLQSGMARPPFRLTGTPQQQADQLALALRRDAVQFVVVSSDFVRRYRDHQVWQACEYLTAHGRAARLFASANSVVYQLLPAGDSDTSPAY